MTVTLNDLIEITAVQDFLGQRCLNVFHYRLDSFDAGIDLPNFASVFNGFWTTAMRPILSSQLTLTSIDVRNLSDGISIYQLPASITGLVSGEPMPSFVTWAFRLNRATAITRHGQKRFAGVPENAVNGNLQNGTLTTALNTVATAIAAGLEVSGGANDFLLSPVIIGRTLNAEGQYELDLNKVNDVLSVQYTRVSTQTTRRIGRGV